MKTASEIATEAARLVGGDRAQQHGAKGVNFNATAVLWNAYLSIRKGGAAAPISGSDFAMMMVLAKMSRVHTGSVFNMDNFVDMAGYSACAGEVALQEQSAPVVETNPWHVYHVSDVAPDGIVDVQWKDGGQTDGYPSHRIEWNNVAWWRPSHA